MEIPSQQNAATKLRILYPIWLVTGMVGLMIVPSQIIVKGDAAQTAANLLSNELLFRVGIVSSLLTQLIFIVAALLLYRLFESVNKGRALMMVVLALVSVPIAMLNTLNDVGALLAVKNPEQMMFYLDLSGQGVVIASIFWGLWLFPLGLLTYASGYFPKIMGIFLLIGGVGYTGGSFLKLMEPGWLTVISIFEVLTFGEVIFLAWLVIRGAKLEKV